MNKIFVLVFIFFVVQVSAKDYCQHPKVKPLIERLQNSLPIKVDSATTIYSFTCVDSMYIYYVALDTNQFTDDELKASYQFDQNQADSLYKQSKGKLHARYVYHKLDGTLLHVVNGK